MRLPKVRFDLSSVKSLLPNSSSQEARPHPQQGQQQQHYAPVAPLQQQHTVLSLSPQQQQSEGSSISSKLQESLSKGFESSMKLISRAKGSSSSSPEAPKQPDPHPYQQQQQHFPTAQGTTSTYISPDRAIAAAAGARLAARSAAAAPQHTTDATHAATDQKTSTVYTSTQDADVAALSSSTGPSRSQHTISLAVKPLHEISEDKSMAFDDEAAPTATVGPMPGPPTQLQQFVDASVKVATPVRVLRILQITFTLITGIATIVLASFRVVTQAADTGAPGSEKGQNVDCNVALLGPTSYKFSINSLILLLLACTVICLAFLIPGLARKVAWLAYTFNHTPANILLGAPPPGTFQSPKTAIPTFMKQPVQGRWAQWLLLPTTNNSWHIALAIGWAVIFAITCFGTYRYNCARVGALLGLSFVVFGAHVSSALLGWWVRIKMWQLLGGGAAAGAGSGPLPVPMIKKSRAGAGGVSDVEMGALGQDQMAAAATAAAAAVMGGVDFEEPVGVQPLVVQLKPNQLSPKTKSH